MRDNGCSGCKYEHLKGSEKPCCDCANMYMDKYEPITNADKIRNMSDEELIELITGLSKHCLAGIGECDCSTYETCQNCNMEVKKWLQSEAE